MIIWDYIGNAFFFPAHQISLIHFAISKTYLCFTSKSLEQQIHKPQCLTCALCIMYHEIEKGVILGSCLEFLVLASAVRQVGAFRQVLCGEAEEVYRMFSNKKYFPGSTFWVWGYALQENMPLMRSLLDSILFAFWRVWR